jgi:hypothetical protein
VQNSAAGERRGRAIVGVLVACAPSPSPPANRLKLLLLLVSHVRVRVTKNHRVGGISYAGQ